MASPQFDYRLSSQEVGDSYQQNNAQLQRGTNCRLNRISNGIFEPPDAMASRVDEVYDLQASIDAERWAKQRSGQ